MASRAPVARLSPAKQQKDMINGPSIIQPFMHQAFLSCIVLPCLPYLAACLSESPVSPVSPVYLSIHISYTYPSIHPSMHVKEAIHQAIITPYHIQSCHMFLFVLMYRDSFVDVISRITIFAGYLQQPKSSYFNPPSCQSVYPKHLVSMALVIVACVLKIVLKVRT